MFKKSTEQKQHLRTLQIRLKKLLLFKRVWCGVLLSRDFLLFANEKMKIKRKEKIEETMQKVSAMRILRMWRKRKLDAKIKLLTPN